MEFTVKTSIDASADKLWGILGSDYSNIGSWTSQVLESHGPENVGPGEARVCQTAGFGDTLETLVRYDDDQREFAFTMESEKSPFFMREILNTWSVEPKGDGRSDVQVHVKVKLLPVFAQLLGGRMSKRMAKRGDSILEELKFYAENGEVHPRKMRQLAAA